MALKKIWRTVKITVRHSQRLQDVLVDVDLETISAQPFNYLAEKNIAKIRIAPPAAGRECNVSIGKHRSHLRPLRGFERLPVAILRVIALPRPRGIAESRAVR